MSSSSKSKKKSASSHGVLDYLHKSLPKSTLLDLYGDETRGRYVCRAVLQQLPPVAQQVVLRLCCSGGIFAKEGVLIWTKQDSSWVQELQKWSLASVKDDQVTLTPQFYKGLKQMLDSSDSSPWTPLTPIELQQLDSTVTLDDLDRHVRQQWSTVLHFLVGTPTQASPPPAVVHFLLQTGLMQTDPDYHGSNVEDAPLVITTKGYDFMLQEGPQQVWHFCQQYLQSLEGHKKRKELLKEALLFLICLGFGRVGDAYPSSTLDKDARILMKDLALFGLLYVQKVKGQHIFYPTRVAMQLLQGDNIADEHVNRNNNSRRQKALENDLKNPHQDSAHLAIIVQTNFQLCAYTVSELHVSMLGLFCDVSTIRRLPNMVFMVLTRDSVKAAFNLGISAKQIIKFLEKHAHPNLTDEIIPQNVVDQIWLWDRERHRVKWNQVYTHNVLMNNEYEAVKQYAIDIKAYAWGDDVRKNEILVKYSYAERVMEFTRRWRAKATAERED